MVWQVWLPFRNGWFSFGFVLVLPTNYDIFLLLPTEQFRTGAPPGRTQVDSEYQAGLTSPWWRYVRQQEDGTTWCTSRGVQRVISC